MPWPKEGPGLRTVLSLSRHRLRLGSATSSVEAAITAFATRRAGLASTAMSQEGKT